MYENDEISIATTLFGKTRCDDTGVYPILLAAAEYFGAKKVSCITHEEQIQPEVQTDSIDMARAIFE